MLIYYLFYKQLRQVSNKQLLHNKHLYGFINKTNKIPLMNTSTYFIRTFAIFKTLLLFLKQQKIPY